MPTFVLRGRIGASPLAVFDVLADVSNMGRLFAGAGPDEVVGGPMRAGARLRRRRTVEGTSVEAEADVEVFRPGKELILRGESRGIRIEQRWRLVPEGGAAASAGAATGATNVEYECRVDGSGLASLMAGAVLGALKKADADHLERLRALVETR